MRKKLYVLTGCLLFTILPVVLFAQSITVAGQVTGQGGEPLNGATISVENSP